jgi:AcrR family transcriptional regulator
MASTGWPTDAHMKPKKKILAPRKTAKSHDELPRMSDWQNPRVVQILDAATRRFARDGLVSTTVQEIAEEAGLTKSMIHYYFESKQVLILELQAFVHERYFRRVAAKLEELASAAIGTEERLQAVLWEVYDIVDDKQFLRLQLELIAEAGRDPYMRSRMQLAFERQREFVEQGQEQVANPAGEMPIRLPRSLSLLISSVLLGIRVNEIVTGDEKTARNAWGLFIAMLTGAMVRTRQETAAQKPAG